MEPSIVISPTFAGRMPRRHLLNKEGTISGWFWMRDQQAPPGELFRVSASGFLLRAEINEGEVVLARNSEVVSAPLEENENGWCHVVLIWSPTALAISINVRLVEIQTRPAFAPFELIEWARRQDIAPALTYPNKAAFRAAIVNGLSGLEDKIKTTGMQDAFWDFTYDGRRIIQRKPKRETQVHPTIYGLLHDLALAKNLSVFPEAKSARGFLDFLVTGSLNGATTCKACVEFKHAHSADLENGLLFQLPEYMRTHATNIGMYCVPFFKGKFFNEPAEDMKRLQFTLHDQAAKAGLNDTQNVAIDIFLIDVSDGVSPSRKRNG